MNENICRTDVNNTFVCNDCSEVRPRTEISKGWKLCIVCVKQRQKAYRDKNKDKTRIENKKYREENAEGIKAQRAAYRELNREKLRVANKTNWAKNGKKYSASHYKWKVNKLKTDVRFKLQETIRSRIAMAIKGQAKTGSAIELLGCSMEEFRLHIERQWLPGMTWENWSLKGWHLDHIKPIKDFDLTDAKQLTEVCHYTNMQPLWASDNLAKRFIKYQK